MSDEIKSRFNDKVSAEYVARLKAVKELEVEWKRLASERREIYLWVLDAITMRQQERPLRVYTPAFALRIEAHKKVLRDTIAAIDESEAAGFYGDNRGSGVRGSGVREPQSAIHDSNSETGTEPATAGERRSDDASAAATPTGDPTRTGSDGN